MFVSNMDSNSAFTDAFFNPLTAIGYFSPPIPNKVTK